MMNTLNAAPFRLRSRATRALPRAGAFPSIVTLALASAAGLAPEEAEAQDAEPRHWIRTPSERPTSFLARPGDPDAEGMRPGDEACILPVGSRLALASAPTVAPEDPSYLRVVLRAPTAGCAFAAGWIYRAHLEGNSAENAPTTSFRLRVTQDAVLRAEGGAGAPGGAGGADAATPRCRLPADVVLGLARAPRWKAGAPGNIEVVLAGPLLGCALREGVIDAKNVDLAESTFPAREFEDAREATSARHWFVTGDEPAALRVRADVPVDALDPRTGRCRLEPNTRYALARAPSHHAGNLFRVEILRRRANCDFTVGFVDRARLVEASSAEGVPAEENADVRGAPGGFWIQTGARSPYLRIRADVPPDALEDGSGKCALEPGRRYWLARAPGFHDDDTLQVLFAEPIAGCRFPFGYVTRKLVVASSPVSGVARASARDGVLARVAAAAISFQDRDVFAAGCPRAYRRGSGSVCCARLVSLVLARAGVEFTPSDAVVGLVANLRAAGWTRVDVPRAPLGAVVFHDDAPGVHSGQHVGICAEKGCRRAWNSWQQRFALNGYPSMGKFERFMAKGGDWGGALVPPSP